jgi:hypothetical protein
VGLVGACRPTETHPNTAAGLAVLTHRATAGAVNERRTAEDYVPLEELLAPTMDEIDAGSAITDCNRLNISLYPPAEAMCDPCRIEGVTRRILG